MSFVFWKILKSNPEFAKQIRKVLGFNSIVSKILSARFTSLEKLSNFIKVGDLESPFSILGMDVAVNRLKKAISLRQRIAIYGDYDCDGICASAMLFSYLKKRFNADVVCHIPERREGYGLNVEAVRVLKDEGVDLILTVDNGIKAVEEAQLISTLGIDLIITDHHNVASELPKAVAILNPKQPGDFSKFKNVCGAVVVLKFIAAMEGGDYDFAFNFAVDLAAIATVADLVPLVSENRVVVLKGLLQLRKSNNLGLLELLRLVFPNENWLINSTDLAFRICPLINASGRIKSANLAFELLTCDELELVRSKAYELVQTNSLRKQIQLELTKKAFDFVVQNVDCLSLPVLVVYGKNWPSGLIGLIAGSLLQKFKKPVVVLTIENEIAIGSARSFESFKIFDALNYCRELFLKWGGHDFAGGLTLKTDKIKEFIVKINEFASLKMFAFVYRVDLVASLAEVNLDFVRSLQVLEPFGKSNEQPLILFKNLQLLKIVPLKQGAHLCLEFMQNGIKAKFLAFNFAFKEFYYKIGNKFNAVATVEISYFMGNERLSFKLVDLRPVCFKQSSLIESFKFIKCLSQKEELVKAQFYQNFKPKRVDFVFIYSKLKQIKNFYGGFFEFFCLNCDKINYFKVFVVLNVFIELGLIEFNGFEFKIKSNVRVKLESSKFLKKWFN